MIFSQPAISALLLTTAAFGTAGADDGQGSAAPGSRLEQLRPGRHLMGPQFSASDHLGKVVVVEIGGG